MLMAACERYVLGKKRSSVTFEYTLMQGVNDRPEHALELVQLLRRFTRRVQDANGAKVNLIPFNPYPGTQYVRPGEADIRAFQEILQRNGILAMVRRTRGDDIDAACGQLKGQVMDRGQRQAKFRAELARLDAGGRRATA